MGWYQIFQDGPEYEQRKQKGSFIPPNISIKDVHAAVPKHLFKRSTSISLYYILRHLAVTYAFHQLGLKIDSVTVSSPPIWRPVITASFWLLYWGWQGMAFAGIWCLGHEVRVLPSPEFIPFDDSAGWARWSFGTPMV
ncbi:hypothetical protein VKT23_013450 [Stygiomarasmius scandens]|uniref:Uncharacterized protein n=1 Tax=Marasmiellus scandens TaxID=2682957 RepID=A0ABR1J4P8_9AGAR